MITMKKLQKQIEDIKNELIRPTQVKFIARKTIYKNNENYEKIKENLKKRGFELTRSETTTGFGSDLLGNKEIWEKEYAEGEF